MKQTDYSFLRLGAHQAVAYTATAGNTTAFSGKAGLIRVVATSNCHIKIGTGVTATTSDVYLPLGVVEYFVCQEGERLSAIQSSAGGTVHVTEMSR